LVKVTELIERTDRYEAYIKISKLCFKRFSAQTKIVKKNTKKLSFEIIFFLLFFNL
jgi:hypothetical protein